MRRQLSLLGVLAILLIASACSGGSDGAAPTTTTGATATSAAVVASTTRPQGSTVSTEPAPPTTRPGDQLLVMTPGGTLDAKALQLTLKIVRQRVSRYPRVEAEVRPNGKTVEVRIKGGTASELRDIRAALQMRGELSFAPVLAAGGPIGVLDATGRVHYQIGPNVVTGADVQSAFAVATPDWVVSLVIRTGRQAQADRGFDSCFAGDATCPTKQIAVVLDGFVQSAPTVNASHLASNPEGLQIGGGLTETAAKALAAALATQPLPLTFIVTQG